MFGLSCSNGWKRDRGKCLEESRGVSRYEVLETYTRRETRNRGLDWKQVEVHNRMCSGNGRSKGLRHLDLFYK